jgi:hypothetical protein
MISRIIIDLAPKVRKSGSLAYEGGLATNKNVVMGPDGTWTQEQLFWWGLAATYYSVLHTDFFRGSIESKKILVQRQHQGSVYSTALHFYREAKYMTSTPKINNEWSMCYSFLGILVTMYWDTATKSNHIPEEARLFWQ